MLEVALVQWQTCCLESVGVIPDCNSSVSCPDYFRFAICPVPFRYDTSENIRGACPFGHYSSVNEKMKNLSSTGNISFTFGDAISPKFPNPASFYIHESISVS